MTPVARVPADVHSASGVSRRERTVPEEVAVAFSYDGGTHAVMMATPRDLEDLAVGFTLSESIVTAPAEIRDLAVVEEEAGIELRMWLAEARAEALRARRRHLAGPTGCGLCGIESLAEAMRTAPAVSKGPTLTGEDITAAIEALAPLQPLNHESCGAHAASFWRRGEGIVLVREDVGRHNALDKLIGAMARGGVAAGDGMLVLTSRVSVEMVQKAATAGFPILVAVSVPTALAIRSTEAAGMTLAAIARSDGFEVFTHPGRITAGAMADVA